MNARNEAFDQAFWQAVDDMNAGTAKSIETYLKLVPKAEQDELARMLAEVLVVRGPAPTPSATESEGYARTLAIIDDVLGTASPSGILPASLKTMRNARGIERDHIVDHLAAEFEITSEAGRNSLVRFYHRLESGKLLGSKLSNRLMEALAAIFKIDVRDLIAGAEPTGSTQLSALPGMGRPSGSAGPPGRAERTADLLPDPEVERVERLFTGGPNA